MSGALSFELKVIHHEQCVLVQVTEEFEHWFSREGLHLEVSTLLHKRK